MDPIHNITNYKFGVFYYNPGDSRTLVPKRAGMLGYQLNFAKGRRLILPVLIIALALFLLNKLTF